MSCPAITNKGGKLSISRLPVACELTLPELALLDYAVVPGVGSIGDTGIEQDISSYSTTNAGISPQSKAAAVGKVWDVEMIESQSAARDVFETASAVGNKDTYATRIEWPDGAVEFSIVQVSSPTYVKGAPSGVRIVRYTMIPSFIPIVTNSLPVATSVAIDGVPFIGATLSATYNYYSPLGLPEAGTDYQWYADGVAIPGETSTTLLLTGGHIGSLITFGVTPSDGLSYGREVISVSVGPVADSARFTADSGLYTDTALTVPVTSYGDAVAGWRGGVLVGVQPTLTARPAYGGMPVSGMPDTPILYYDLGDDVLPAAMTLPAITSGTLVIAGEDGIWIEDSFNHAGGSWSLGPTTYTGGPAGLLPSLIGNRVLGFAVFAGQLTPAELQVEVAYWMGRGAPGVWEAGSELKTNHDFSTGDLTGWTNNAVAPKTVTVDGSNNAVIDNGGGTASGTELLVGLTYSSTITTGDLLLVATDMAAVSNSYKYVIGAGGTIYVQSNTNTALTQRNVVAVTSASQFRVAFGLQSGDNDTASVASVSVKRLTLNTDPYP